MGATGEEGQTALIGVLDAAESYPSYLAANLLRMVSPDRSTVPSLVTALETLPADQNWGPDARREVILTLAAIGPGAAQATSAIRQIAENKREESLTRRFARFTLDRIDRSR